MKLFLAAPASGLPSLLMGLPSQASCLHFLTKLVFAAPESGLPSLLRALDSHDWAIAVPTANDVMRAARIMRFMVSSRRCHLKHNQRRLEHNWEIRRWRIFV